MIERGERDFGTTSWLVDRLRPSRCPVALGGKELIRCDGDRETIVVRDYDGDEGMKSVLFTL